MIIRPHPTLHMISWCFAGSIIITVLSGIMLGNVVSQNIWLLAGISGFALGIPLGVLEGGILSYMTRDIVPPYTRDMMKKHLFPPIVFFFFTAIVIAFFSLPMIYDVMNNDPFVAILYASVPILLAGLTSAYAVRRYLFRLTIWSANQEARKSKSKPKNTMHDASRLKKRETEANLPEHESPEQKSKWMK